MMFDYDTCRVDIDLDLGFSIALDHTSGARKEVCIEELKKQSFSLGLNKITQINSFIASIFIFRCVSFI